MRAVVAVVLSACGLLAAPVAAQEKPAPTETQKQPPGFPQIQFYPDQPPTLSPAAPRMPVPPPFPPPADPRVIYFDPYFYPTHFNFRPFPYGYPPTDPGFFYGAFANPYYYQYYGPGEYYGF